MVNGGTAPAARQGEMDIPVVILVYNEKAALPELYRALADIIDQLPQSAEIIFVEDAAGPGPALWAKLWPDRRADSDNLGEPISPARWLGIACIGLGIALVGLSANI